MATTHSIHQLPSMPQVLVKILDAIHGDTADYRQIAEIIHHDPAIAARIIAVANSSYYGRDNYGRDNACTTIERALLVLGTEAVKTTVITAAIKQFFSHFNTKHNQFLKQFWRRSLVSANFAKVLATLTSYSAPEEAYLCGLLADIGQLVLLTRHDETYLRMVNEHQDTQALLAAEFQLYQTDHCILGSEIASEWSLSGFMIDALRYHHEDPLQIRDAHHLVKVINLSTLLGYGDTPSEQALEAADLLFGLNEALTIELRQRIDADVNRLAQSLGIAIDIEDDDYSSAYRLLGDRLQQLGTVAHLTDDLWLADNALAFKIAIDRSLLLSLGVRKSTLFILDTQQHCLTTALAPKGEPDAGDTVINIALEEGRSLLVDAALKTAICDSSQYPLLSVIDRQLIRECGNSALLAWPLIREQKAVGVIAMGVSKEQLPQLREREALFSGLFAHIAARLNNQQHVVEQSAAGAIAAELRIRETIHEASNPLSIIRNYLETLKHKLHDDDSAMERLEFIREEIERVGHILLRLHQPHQHTPNPESADINLIIQEIADIYAVSICNNKNITVKLALDGRIQKTVCHEIHLRQILTNLIKNAVEALASGGEVGEELAGEPGREIVLSSEAEVSIGNQLYNAISVADNGPGISADVKQHLFSPMISTKGSGHSGLGLSIVKKLVDEMSGTIVCRNNGTTGTVFQILLPQ